jgi:hypothetical protein
MARTVMSTDRRDGLDVPEFASQPAKRCKASPGTSQVEDAAGLMAADGHGDMFSNPGPVQIADGTPS